MELKKIKITICQSCLDGIGKECHTPGCALFLHKVDLPIAKELYEIDAEERLERIRDAYIAHLEDDLRRFQNKIKYMDEPREELSKDDLKRHYEKQIGYAETTIEIIRNV